MNARRERDIERAKHNLKWVEKVLSNEDYFKRQHKALAIRQILRGYKEPITFEDFSKGVQTIKEKAECCLYEVTRIPQLKL